MKQYKIVKIKEQPEWIQQASEWFHSKWHIQQEAYFQSMKESIDNDTVIPQWYIVFDKESIIAGLGVIKNDFHDRKDLSPNVCAVYVEEKYRKQGIAGYMLNYVCNDFKENGIDTLYLVTDHTSFYERYNWRFLCMAQGDGEPEMTRMYVHEAK